MNGIDVAAFGWEFADGVARFYPADLPAEWRLGYYANEFSAVVVPATLWQSVSAEAVVAWGREVDAGFRFYWELPQGDAAQAGRLAAPLQLLAAQSGGVILRSELSAEARTLLQPLALPLGHWPQGDAVARGAGLAVVRASAQPRQLRQQLEAMAAEGGGTAGVVVCEGLAALRQAKLVAELLGVSRSA